MTPSRPWRFILAAVVAISFVAGCGGDDDDDVADDPTTTTEREATGTTSSSTTTEAPSTTATPTFDGSTSPTSAPPPASQTEVAQLVSVDVVDADGIESVVFGFDDNQLPGFDVNYIEPPIRADGSGDEVEVDGEAFLEIRMEPASGVDLSSGSFEETYTGPDRLAGTGGGGVIVEVVRTGDFEANLTWVVGLSGEIPYRVEVAASPASLTVTFGPGSA